MESPSQLILIPMKDFPAEIFAQRPILVTSLCSFIGTVPDDKHMAHSLDAIKLFLEKLLERVVTWNSPDWVTTHQPGYPLGFDPEGIDSWENETIEELQKDCLKIIISDNELNQRKFW